MRDLKFRVFISGKVVGQKNGFFYYPSKISDFKLVFDDDGFSLRRRYFGWVDEKHFEVDQFIGLKDMHGVEIYERDIVRCIHSGGLSSVHEIKYLSEGNYPAFDLFPPVYCDSNSIHYFMEDGTIEVIDNTHENVEIKGGL